MAWCIHESPINEHSLHTKFYPSPHADASSNPMDKSRLRLMQRFAFPTQHALEKYRVCGVALWLAAGPLNGFSPLHKPCNTLTQHELEKQPSCEVDASCVSPRSQSVICIANDSLALLCDQQSPKTPFNSSQRERKTLTRHQIAKPNSCEVEATMHLPEQT